MKYLQLNKYMKTEIKITLIICITILIFTWSIVLHDIITKLIIR